jgi:hypothetical protein
MSNHARHKSQGKSARAQAKAEQAQAELAEAELAEAETKVAKEQAAAIARALHEDEAHRQADLHEVAEKEGEAVQDWPPAPDSGMKTRPHQHMSSPLQITVSFPSPAE